jgi:hypothetical protein
MLNICKNENENKNEINKANEEYDKLCLICMDVKGEIILCSKCKYIYCSICAEKINKLCSICFRNINKTNSNQNYYFYEYNTYYDDLVFEPSALHYFSVMASFAANAIIGFCCVILFVIFGYIGVIFLLRIIINLINFF